ncbi:MAG: hypothetical protein KAI79_14455 [Bacteroidales bacterium]|nr:hypothetical protein [Bacteroidales bacterium]
MMDLDWNFITNHRLKPILKRGAKIIIISTPKSPFFTSANDDFYTENIANNHEKVPPFLADFGALNDTLSITLKRNIIKKQ